MIKNINNLTFRYLKAQKKRTLLTIVGIMLSVALITAIGTMVVSMRDKMIQDAIKESGDYHAEFLGVNSDTVNKIRNNVNIKSTAISKGEEFAIMSDTNSEEKKNDESCPPYRYLSLNECDKDMFNIFNVVLKEGRLPEKNGEIAVDYWAANYIKGKPKIGDKIKLTTGLRKDNRKYLASGEWSANEVFEKNGEKEFTIVGFVKPTISWVTGYIANGITYLDSSRLSEGIKYNVFAKLNSIKNVHDKVQKIAESAGMEKVKTEENAGYNIKYNERVLRLSAESLDKTLNKTMVYILILIILLVVVSTIAVIYNAFNISVIERISQFGVLRCSGASPEQVKMTVLKEAGIMSIAGIPIGLFLGIAAMKVVLFIIGRFTYVYEAFQDLNIVISPAVLLMGCILGVITVYLSALGPAIRASKVSPLEAVRKSGAFRKESFKNVKKSPFAGAMLKIEGYIASKNIRRNRKRFNITVFSMVISIVLYIAFGSFVSYVFKMGVVDGKDAPDFSVWRNGSAGVESSIYNDIKGLAGVDKVYKEMTGYADVLVPANKINPRFKELKGQDLQDMKGDSVILHNSMIRCFGDDAFPSLKEFLENGSIDLNNLNKENDVILVQKGKLSNGKSSAGAIIDATEFKVGDNISFNVESDSKNAKVKSDSYVTAKVMAVLNQSIWPDKYNENGGIYIITSEKMYEKFIGDKNYNNMHIKLADNADKESVSKYLKSLNERDISYQYTDYAEKAGKDRDATIAMSIFLYGFVAVIALIGCLNIINTISTNLILRKRELSMLRAVGMTGGGIKKMVGMEGVLYGVYAAIFGGIIGTATSFAFYRILLGVREIDWSIPWVQIFTAVVGAIAVTLLSSLIPLRKINNGNIIDNIRAEE